MPRSRRDDLIDAAMRAFHRSGFRATCLDKVLEEGGISRMTIYNHFRSKDELIVAALRRRDETFRHRMMKSVETRADDPVARILAIFDFHEAEFESDDFNGCMFIKAAAEYADPSSPIRAVAAEHQIAISRYIQTQCERAGDPSPAVTAEQLAMLLEGAMVMAHVVGQVGHGGATPARFAATAKQAAGQLLRAACGAAP